MPHRLSHWPVKLYRMVSLCVVPGLLLAQAAWTIRSVLHNPATCLPVQQNMLTTVPLFNAWTVWWNADRLSHGFVGYWDAPIFFPARGAFAFSEPQPATVVVAPLVWMMDSPTLAYNVYLLLSLFLNGWLTFRLLRRIGTAASLSLLGAAMIIWLPLSVRQIDVLQLIPVWPMLWVWDALRRHGHAPTWRNAVELSISYTLCVYSSVHHALFLTITLAGTAWVLWMRALNCRFWETSALAIVLAGLCCGPFLMTIHHHLAANHFARSSDEAAQRSATFADFLNTPRDSFLLPGSEHRMGMSPGWLKVSLGMTAIALSIRRRKSRRWILFLLLTATVSVVLALGPNFQVASFSPWQKLMALVPGVSQVRNVYRFVYLTQMAVILLAVTGLSRLQTLLRWHFRHRRVISFAVNAIGLLALLEVPAPPVLSAGVPDFSRHQQWLRFLEENCPEGAGVLCLPLPDSSRAQDYDFTARWMFLGTQHGAPLVNGYSGFFPAASLDLQNRIRLHGLSADALSDLIVMNVQLIVIHPSDSLSLSAAEKPESSRRLQRVFEDTNGIQIFRLLPAMP